MRLIDADIVKEEYRKRLVANLTDNERGIDLSEYAKEPCKKFEDFVDSIPTVKPCTN